jgi:hypothetical protein
MREVTYLPHGSSGRRVVAPRSTGPLESELVTILYPLVTQVLRQHASHAKHLRHLAKILDHVSKMLTIANL